MKYPLMRNNILREDLDEVIKHLQTDDPILTNGPYVRKFEEEWSKWLGVKYSVFVNSGSSANLLSMAVLKISNPSGGEVIVPPLTWSSDISSVIQNGFTPIFVDINPKTLSIDTDELLEKINDKTIAVFLTHAQGFNGLTDKMLSKLEEKNIPLIEDVCESHGATHKGKKIGSFGWMSNFSFFYAHHMSTIEGGIICTDSQEVYQQLRMLRSHGMVRESNDESTKAFYVNSYPELNPDFIFAFPSYNVRNTEIGGIMGLMQLKRLDANIAQRTKNFIKFLKKIDSNKYRTDFKIEGSSNYAFNLILKKPDNVFVKKLMLKMYDSGIEFRRGSAGGGNQTRQPYVNKLLPKNHHLNFPETEHIHFFGFYIGNFPDLTEGELDEICDILNSLD
jgi:CDP-4-dehydro-6-deoxyglucose reductase, E1